MSDCPPAIHVPKTRHGGSFTDPRDVNLHANDFSWEEKIAELTADEKKLVDEYLEICGEALADPCPAPRPQKEKTDTPAPEPWESHYSSSRHHFPIKNYIIKAFPVLSRYLDGSSLDSPAIMECGCGTGSTLLPLMKQTTCTNVQFVGFDVSRTSVAYFSSHEVARSLIEERRLHVFAYDAAGRPSDDESAADGEQPSKRHRMEHSSEHLARAIGCEFPSLSGVKYDVVLLVFVLSALPTAEDMRVALRQLRHVMKPDGVLLFRDYALPDHNFFRFIMKNDGKVPGLRFPKGDGTSQTFFEQEFTKKLFAECGLVDSAADGEHLQYHCNRIVNRKNGKRMDKIFINGVFRIKEQGTP